MVSSGSQFCVADNLKSLVTKVAAFAEVGIAVSETKLHYDPRPAFPISLLFSGTLPIVSTNAICSGKRHAWNGA